MKTNKACPNPPENLLARCLNTIPADAVFPEATQTPGRTHLRLEPPSRNRLRWLTLAAAVPVLSLLVILPIRHYLASRADGTVASSPESVTVSIKFTPDHTESRFIQNPGHKGRLQVIFREGTREESFSNGPNAFYGDSADARPQVTADHRTVGWLWGHWVKIYDTKDPNAKNYAFLPQQLCVYRQGSSGRSIRGERGFIEAFHFWNGGKQVVFRTRGLHGVSDVVLYDIESDKEVAKLPGYKVNAASPAWAQGLGD